MNLGSGIGVTIKELAETISPEVIWDISKPNGDKKRLMDTKRAESYGFKPEISLKDGIAETMDWYRQHRDYSGRYTPFKEFL